MLDLDSRVHFHEEVLIGIHNTLKSGDRVEPNRLTESGRFRFHSFEYFEIGGEGAFLKSNEDDTFDGNLTVSGNLTVEGTTTQVDSTTVEIADAMLSLAKDNSTDSVDSGFYAQYNDGTEKFTGLARDASDGGKYILYEGVGSEPTTTVPTNDAGFAIATLKANIEGETLDVNLPTATGAKLTGTFVVSSFEGNGDHDGAYEFSATFMSSGAVTYTAGT